MLNKFNWQKIKRNEMKGVLLQALGFPCLSVRCSPDSLEGNTVTCKQAFTN